MSELDDIRADARAQQCGSAPNTDACAALRLIERLAAELERMTDALSGRIESLEEGTRAWKERR